MAFNFPDAPSAGRTSVTDAASGAQYIYKSGVWMQSSAAQIKLGALEPNLIVNPRGTITQELGAGVTVMTTGAYSSPTSG